MCVDFQAALKIVSLFSGIWYTNRSALCSALEDHVLQLGSLLQANGNLRQKADYWGGKRTNALVQVVHSQDSPVRL